ncbi:ABC transporter ATP-binding protein, partial [Candidatus Hodarchaeum mangrovi]
GEIISILGPNGAGKSTTINMLTTILKPTEGIALVNNKDVTIDYSFIKTYIGVVPQEYVFYEELTAEENLIFFGLMHGISKKTLKKDAEVILTKLGLIGRKDKTKNFSGGMKRRLNIAIALIMKPEIFFLDEPSAGLDPQSKRVVWECIKELKHQGKTVILCTHNMHEAEILSDRVIIMNNGSIIAEGSPYELKRKYGESYYVEITFKQKENIFEFEGRIKSLPYLKRTFVESNNKINLFFDGGLIKFVKILQYSLIDDIDDIESITFRETTLEDVFLKLTGRRLKE